MAEVGPGGAKRRYLECRAIWGRGREGEIVQLGTILRLDLEIRSSAAARGEIEGPQLRGGDRDRHCFGSGQRDLACDYIFEPAGPTERPTGRGSDLITSTVVAEEHSHL